MLSFSKVLLGTFLLLSPAQAEGPKPLYPSSFFINLNLVKRVECSTGTGTGSVIAPDTVLTAQHVIDKATACYIDGQAAEVAYSSKELDIAVLKVPLVGIYQQRLNINCSPYVEGRIYYAVGWAYGTNLVVQRVGGTKGYSSIRIDAADYKLDHMKLLRGSVFHGMSGGPIVDENGYIVGVINTVNPNIPIAGTREVLDTFLCK